MPNLHAWFSKKQEKIKGCHHIYKTPMGLEVKCTQVNNTMEHNCLFDDMEYLGKVLSYKDNGYVRDVITEITSLKKAHARRRRFVDWP